MTTIIVVVVVALVFFVAVCVVSFMIWKRESEMRTDSIRAIEENLEKLTHGLPSNVHTDDRENFVSRERKSDIAYVESVMTEDRSSRSQRNRSWDPFGWVRETECSVRNEEDLPSAEEQRKEPENNNIEDQNEEAEMQQEAVKLREDIGEKPAEPEAEIEPEQEPETETKPEKQTADTTTDYEINLDFIDIMKTENDYDQTSKPQMGYDIGRSGKKYTASELETLIKE